MFLHSDSGDISLLRGGALLASLLVSYVVATVVYRLYFHPLAKYPGPFWAKISTWPAYIQTQKRNRHVWLLSLQEKYGKSDTGRCTTAQI